MTSIECIMNVVDDEVVEHAPPSVTQEEEKKRKRLTVTRKKKLLHPKVAALTDKDSATFTLGIENDPNKRSLTYGVEFTCARTCRITDNDGQVEVFILSDFNLDQLRQLCVLIVSST